MSERDFTPEEVQERYRVLVESVTDYAIFLLDPTGHVATWNPGAQRIKGYEAHEIIGKHFSTFYTREAVERGWPDHELRVAAAEGRFEDEGWRVRKDGTQFWADVVIVALRNAKGELLGFGKITRDLTQRRLEQETLRHSEERFRLLVDSVKDYAIFMLDPDGRIASWNAGAERINGYSADEIIGQHFSKFYTPEAIAIDWPGQELRIARKEGRYEEEGWRVRKDGSRFWANVVISAVFDASGSLRGFAKVTRDLTQRQRLQDLVDAGRQMAEFLAMLAHELRNPLAPIRNAMQIMAMRKLEDPQLEWCRGVVDRQVEHLGRLVDDLLDVNRVTSGKILLKREPVPLAIVLDRAIESTAPLLEERKHEVKIALPSESLVVNGDATRLAQVFLNLLNNAAKYTPQGGTIEVLGGVEQGQAVVRVRDNGVGIGAELLPRVFDLFVQGSRSLDRAEGGLGIGLTLVREIVRLHGGTVAVSSPGPQLGSEFTVTLPLLAAAADGTPASTGTAEAESNGRRILVVDDNRDSADSMAMLLQASGHDVRTAHDGIGALEQAPAFRPQFILLDIGLPGMSGYAVAERLRALPGLHGVTLIAMTGYGQEEDRRRAREAGFDHHLLKPVDLDELNALLNRTSAAAKPARQP